MSIHCDVCGTILLGGWENEGGFPTPDGFVSKSPHGGRGRIENTCTPCGSIISNEIKITIKNVVEKLRNQ
jgi:hypothetical protein